MCCNALIYFPWMYVFWKSTINIDNMKAFDGLAFCVLINLLIIEIIFLLFALYVKWHDGSRQVNKNKGGFG